MHEYSAGNWHKQLEYSSFQPSTINRPRTINDPRVLNALSRADRQLGRLDMFSEYVPNLDLFVRMHVTKGPEVVLAGARHSTSSCACT